jgi:transposase
MLEKVTGKDIRDTDFTDDRLTLLLERLSDEKSWHAIETDSDQNMIRVYDLETKCVRVDPTTVSGYHEGSEEGLFQYGKSKDDPSLRQIKVLAAASDPLGLPLITEVLSGERADDKLYIPAADRIVKIIEKAGLLFVGDCKMSAVETRSHIHQLGHHYLTPLSMVGNNKEKAEEWIQTAVNDPEKLTAAYIKDQKGKDVLLAKGYETKRVCCVEKEGNLCEWEERVITVHSESYAKTLRKGLDERLKNASEKLTNLTPARGKGKRQITDEGELRKSADAILKSHKVEELTDYQFERQEEKEIRYIGRGRGKAGRPKQEIIKVRYQITNIIRNEEAIESLKKTMGRRIYVTDIESDKLSLEQAVLTYRNEWLIERGFHRLKGVPLSLDPMYVKRDDQIAGLTHLLSIAVRFLTLTEFVVRRALKKNNEKLVGLHPENPKKGTDSPTTERLLKTFKGITLTIIQLPYKTIRHVTPLTSLQTRILELLGLSPDIYSFLENNS